MKNNPQKKTGYLVNTYTQVDCMGVGILPDLDFLTDGRLRGCLPASLCGQGGATLVDAQPRSIKKQYHRKYRKSR